MAPRKAIPPRRGNPTPPAGNPNPSPPPVQHAVEVEDFGRDKDIKNLLKTLQPKAFAGEGSDVSKGLKEWIMSMEDYFSL